ncbi:MAG: site-2 protease family protein [Rhodospirillales bacterium]|nr:site-2 protease family protein [Rhodospirillales bacterium]
MDFSGLLFNLSVWAVPVLLAVTLHEAAHGWVAWKLGDDTAYRLGRVSFNPLRHIDPFGTILLPAMLLLASGGRMMFGFAKPVPVNFWRLKSPRRDMVLVAISGPATNVALAIFAAILLHTTPFMTGGFREWYGETLLAAIWINALLAVFNMLPVPPLDGGRVAVGLLPDVLARPLARLERAGIVIILGAFFVIPWIGEAMGQQWNIFWWVIGEPAQALVEMVLRLVRVA